MGAFIRRSIGMSLIVGGVIFAQPVPPAKSHSANLDKGLDDLAGLVLSYATENIKGQRISSTRVLEFETPGNFQPAGRTIQRELQRKLEAKIKEKNSTLKINQKVASHDVGGELLLESSEDKAMIRINARVKTNLGAELQNYSRLIMGPASDIARLTTPTVDVSAALAAEDSDAASEQVKQSIESPAVAVQDAPAGAGEQTVIRASERSRFGIQIRIADSPLGPLSPARISNEGGLAFVNAKRGQRFAVTIVNDADFDVGVRLTLDGIDSFHFSKNERFKGQRTWLIYRHSSQTIPGWYVRDPAPNESVATSKDFVFTDLPDSIAARFASTSSEIGIINALFFPAWKELETPPKEAFAGGVAGRGGLGVGDGSERKVQVGVEQRFFGQSLLASVSVRYEQPKPPADLPAEEPPPSSSSVSPSAKDRKS